MDYKKILTSMPSDQTITIWTYDVYSKEGFKFYKDCLGHLQDCTLIVSKITDSMRQKFETELPCVTLVNKENTHAKILVIPPDIVYLSSQNFGDNPDWFQYAVRIQDWGACQFYMGETADHKDGDSTNNIRQTGNSFADYTRQASNNYGKYIPDYSGISLSAVEAKLEYTVNWNQKFNGYFDRDFLICTYTLPDYGYCQRMIEKLLKQRNRVHFIANTKSEEPLRKLQQEFGKITFEVYSNFHAKMVLVSPVNAGRNGIVWLSSQNFGDSGWFEHLFRLKSATAYEYYLGKLEGFVDHKICW